MNQLFILLISLSSLFANSQNGFSIRDIQAIPLGVYHTQKKQDTYSTGGLHLGIDIGFKILKQDLRIQYNTGSEFAILGSGNDKYSSLNLLYEISPDLLNWMEINVYGGAGVQQQSFIRFPSTEINNSYFNSCIGTRFIFLHRNRISIGIQLQGEFNYDNSTYLFSTVLRYNLKNSTLK